MSSNLLYTRKELIILRMLPFFKPKKGFMIAGGGLDTAGGGGGGGGNHGINYLLDTEIDTGDTWIDGKKIYLRVYHDTTSGAQIQIPQTDVDTPISCGGFMIGSSSIYYIGQYVSSGIYSAGFYDKTNSRWQINRNVTPNNNYIIVRYTKTTD